MDRAAVKGFAVGELEALALGDLAEQVGLRADEPRRDDEAHLVDQALIEQQAGKHATCVGHDGLGGLSEFRDAAGEPCYPPQPTPLSERDAADEILPEDHDNTVGVLWALELDLGVDAGALLELLEAVIADPSLNTREKLFDLARNWSA